MSKARLTLAGTALCGLFALPALIIPATAASSGPSTQTSSGTRSGVSESPGGPLLTVCLTITPKSVDVNINGLNILIGPAGVPRSCIATPF